jgi:hypothetical protein
LLASPAVVLAALHSDLINPGIVFIGCDPPEGFG